MLNVDICGVDFKNPVIAASGTFGFGNEYGELFDVSALGGICTKGLTLEACSGNSGTRIFETSSGIMNSVGMQNVGIHEFIKSKLPYMKSTGTVIIANVGGKTIDEYVEAVDILNSSDIPIIELNISCPNVKEGGMAFGMQADTAYKVVSEVRKACRKILWVKLSPNAEDIVKTASKCEEAGADALSMVNTFKAMAIDIKKRRPVFDNIFAGLSGPAIKPIALRMVYEVCREVAIPVIGMGGISDYMDAIEFIMAGAHAVQVGTANFIKPDVCMDIINGIEEFLIKEGISDIKDIRDIL